MSKFNVRAATVNDVTNLVDLDLKCYDYPVGSGYFKEVIESTSKFALIAATEKEPVGYATVHMENKEGELWRFGVLPEYRRLSIGTLLMKKVIDRLGLNRCDRITTTVPEFLCDPNDPEDVSEFLLFAGFKAVKIRWELFTMYGRVWDGFQFRRKV